MPTHERRGSRYRNKPQYNNQPEDQRLKRAAVAATLTHLFMPVIAGFALGGPAGGFVGLAMGLSSVSSSIAAGLASDWITTKFKQGDNIEPVELSAHIYKTLAANTRRTREVYKAVDRLRGTNAKVQEIYLGSLKSVETQMQANHAELKGKLDSIEGGMGSGFDDVLLLLRPVVEQMSKQGYAGAATTVEPPLPQRAEGKLALITIANFDTRDSAPGAMTDVVLEELPRAIASYTDEVQVAYLGRTISERGPEGTARARQVGEQCQADVVIWGWYRPAAAIDVMLVSVHFELIRHSQFLAGFGDDILGKVRELPTTSLEINVAEELTYLSFCAIGVSLYAAERWQAAAAAFDQALARVKQPNMVSRQDVVYFYQANCYLQENDYQQAKNILEWAVQLGSKMTEVHANLGICYMLLGEYAQALSIYQQAVVAWPHDPGLHTNLGVVYTAQRKWAEAEASYVEAIRLDEGFVAAHINRGSTAMQSGQPDQAIASFTTARNLEPNNAQNHFLLGTAFAAADQQVGAIKCFEEAMDLRPDYAEAQHQLARACYQAGLFPRAVKEFECYLQLKPSDETALLGLGRARFRTGDLEGAFDAIETAVIANPEYVDAYVVHGDTCTLMGDYEQAGVDYDWAIHLDPDTADAHAGRSVTRLVLGDHAGAVADCNWLIEIEPDNAVHYFRRGDAYLCMRFYAAAVRDFTTVIAEVPDYTLAYLNRGRAYLVLGYQQPEQINAAINDFRMVLDYSNDPGLTTYAKLMLASFKPRTDKADLLQWHNERPS